MNTARRRALLDVIEMRRPLEEAAADLGRFPWDCDVPLVTFTRAHAVQALDRYLAGDMSAAALEDWANAFECRDDVGFEEQARTLLEEFVFTFANPFLEGDITPAMARGWRAQLA